MFFRAVLWDVDGTLLNTEKGVAAAITEVLLKNGISMPSEKNILNMVHWPIIQNSFCRICGLSPQEAQELTNLYREEYKSRHLFEATPYDGIFDVMDTLQKRGAKQAIATMKRQDYATEICEHFGFDKYCFPIVGADNENKLTKADLIRKCLQTLNVSDLSSAVMIGDTNGDKTAAETVGIDFIGVNYGFGFDGIKGYADSPKKIKEMIEI